ncbi:MAG: acyl-CoA dehydrogenase family protein [Dehalococcoidia bacterium]|nr:acyl-CoA dehydrogenase family protein [Dehalococcoidia bacterium]
MTAAEQGGASVLGMDEATVRRREYVKKFLEEHIYPNERLFGGLEHNDPEAEAKMKELQQITKKDGYWAPHLVAEAGGMGIGFLPYAYMNEVIGRSAYAPRAFGSQAPDSGNAEILHQYGSAELQERFLKPLVNGDVRSCFSMTEPDVSGADPTGLETTAVRDGDEWVINGRKWFFSGARGAAFAIVMCVTEPDAPPHSRMSQIVVPTDTPGFNIEKQVEVWGDKDATPPDLTMATRASRSATSWANPAAASSSPSDDLVPGASTTACAPSARPSAPST